MGFSRPGLCEDPDSDFFLEDSSGSARFLTEVFLEWLPDLFDSFSSERLLMDFFGVDDLSGSFEFEDMLFLSGDAIGLVGEGGSSCSDLLLGLDLSDTFFSRFYGLYFSTLLSSSSADSLELSLLMNLPFLETTGGLASGLDGLGEAVILGGSLVNESLMPSCGS